MLREGGFIGRVRGGDDGEDGFDVLGVENNSGNSGDGGELLCRYTREISMRERRAEKTEGRKFERKGLLLLR
jgi:hypothetical protein